MKKRSMIVALSTAVATLAVLGAPALASATTETFDYTGGVQTWVVPQGVTSATFDLLGAEGGTAVVPFFGTGGLGGRATATLSVTPGESIEIRVGGTGVAAGGFNGGGSAGGDIPYPAGGGGATDVRRGGSTLNDRVLVAGGGGGSGGCSGVDGPSGGGAGGGLVGGDGTPLSGVTGCVDLAASGKGGTASAGGAAGTGAQAGTLGQGGGGAPGGALYRGGGGGGYYGGGGGGEHSGGGGGSGFGPTGTAFETGVRNGSGSASVTYTVQLFALAVTTTGAGSGQVTSSPAGIDCGATCAADFVMDSEVTLTATPASGSDFAGWSGDCTGTGTCTVTMSQARNVTASFTKTPRLLSVAKTGSGSGAVTSAPVGIDCGATCSASFDDGTSVTLTATPASGSGFAGWSGDCTGTGTCTVTMSQARNVTASFTKTARLLSVAKRGTGSGQVISAPVGIDCGATCLASFDDGTSVALTAAPAAGVVFAGWAGDCTGTGACTVAMDQARNVTATFEPTVTALSITPKSFPTSNADTPLSRLVRKRGAKISVSVSGDALVRFWIRRQPNRKGPKITYSFTRKLTAGDHLVGFTGKLSGRSYSPGRFILRATATDESTGYVSAPASTGFRINR